MIRSAWRNGICIFVAAAVLPAAGFTTGSYAADPLPPPKSLGKAVQTQKAPIAMKPAIEILAPTSMESVTKNVRREGHQQG